MPGAAGAAHQLGNEHLEKRVINKASMKLKQNPYRFIAPGTDLGPSPPGLGRADLLGGGRGLVVGVAVGGAVGGAVGVGGDDAAAAVGLRQGAPGGHVGSGLVVNLVLLSLEKDIAFVFRIL